VTASAQATRVGLEGIEAGALRLRGARHRAVLEVAGGGLALQDAPEREALVAGFAALLNGLTFPVQLVVRVLPVDVERYAAEFEERARRVLPEPLGALARDHAAFVRRLARARTLLERRFYVVVPAQDAPPAARRLWPLGREPDDAADGAAARRLLAAPCDEVARQLGRLLDLAIAHALAPSEATVTELRDSSSG
jgi:hypothetical protein